MRSFSHVETPLRVFSGADCLTKLERELSRLDVSRAVMVTGGTLSRGPLIAMIRDAMGARCAGVYAGVKAHTPRSGVEEAAAELLRLDADAVIAVGGGSAVVTARAASIYLAEGNDLDALCTRRDDSGRMISPRLGADKIPQVVIPTTPNTAMVKAGSAVFDEAAVARKALFDPKTRAQSIFVHPDLLMSAPQGLVVSAALDSFTLGIEGLLSKSGDAMSDAALMHAIRLLAPALRIMDSADGADLRSDLAMAAILCGRGTDHAGAGAGTVLGHAIGANHEVENGIAKAILMPHVLRFNAGHAEAGMRLLATALGVGETADPVESSCNAMVEVFRARRLPEKLVDLGITRTDLVNIAKRGMDDWFLGGNPRPIASTDDLVQILDAAL
jgi:alcohol dehydrogenase